MNRRFIQALQWLEGYGLYHRLIPSGAVLLVVITSITYFDRILRNRSTFNTFYNFARLRWAGQNMYDIPHTELRFYAPSFDILPGLFAWMPLIPAAICWYIFHCGLLIASLYFLSRALRPKLEATWFIASVALVWTIGIHLSNLAEAQVNFVTLFSLSAAWFCYRQEKDLLAGLALAFGIAIKLTPLFLLGFFIIKREWRVLLGVIIGGLIFGLVLPILFFGWENHWWHIRLFITDMLMPMVNNPLDIYQDYHFRHTNQSITAMLVRFFTDTPAGAHIPDFYMNVAAFTKAQVFTFVKYFQWMLIAGLLWLSRHRQDRSNPLLAMQYAMFVALLPILHHGAWINHFVVLLIPYAVAARWVWEYRQAPSIMLKRFNAMVWISFAVMATGVLGSGPSLVAQAFGNVFWATVLLGVGMLFLHAHIVKQGILSE